MRWHTSVAGAREHVPVLLADFATWRRWNGSEEPDESFDVLQGEIGVVDVAGRAIVPSELEGGAFDLGLGDGELVLLQHDVGDSGDFKALRTTLAKRTHDEYLAGELEVDAGVVVGDPWNAGCDLPAMAPSKAGKVAKVGFFAPLPPGRYVVLEGRNDVASWYRLVRGNAADYQRRPADAPKPAADPTQKKVDAILARTKFGTDKAEARALEAARELVALGRSDAALAICDRVGPSRQKLAQWTRIFALATAKQDAITPLRALATEWLAPPTAADSANQVLTRKNMLEAIDAVQTSGADVAELRQEIASAPEPEIFVAGGDDFF